MIVAEKGPLRWLVKYQPLNAEGDFVQGYIPSKS
jgi:hypothetical protein